MCKNYSFMFIQRVSWSLVYNVKIRVKWFVMPIINRNIPPVVGCKIGGISEDASDCCGFWYQVPVLWISLKPV